MVTGIKNTRTAPTTPAPAPAPADDLDAERLATGPANTDLAARRRAIDSTAAAITDDMQAFDLFKGSEARDAVARLQALPPGDARLALDTLSENGVLDTLAKNVDADNRRALVDLMIVSGFVGSEAGRVSGPSSTSGPQPPRAPVFANVGGVYGGDTTTMLRQENLARLDGFREAFDAYRSDYQGAVRGAKSFEALRALGPIAEPTMPLREPGTHGDVPHDWAKRAGTAPDVETGRILTDTIFRLNGRSPPGVDIAFEATVKLGFVEVEGKGGRDRSGATHGEVAVKGTALVASVEGKAELHHGHVKTTTEPVAWGIAGKDNKVLVRKGSVEAELEAGGVKAKVKVKDDETVVGGGARDLGLEASLKKTTDSHGHARTTAKVKAEVEGLTAIGGLDSDGGMVVGVGVDSEHLEAQLEMTTQLVSKADYARAFATIAGDVFSNPPPELASGMKWSSLGPDEAAAYAFYGWDQQRWDATVQQSSQLASARVVGR